MGQHLEANEAKQFTLAHFQLWGRKAPLPKFALHWLCMQYVQCGLWTVDCGCPASKQQMAASLSGSVSSGAHLLRLLVA